MRRGRSTVFPMVPDAPAGAFRESVGTLLQRPNRFTELSGMRAPMRYRPEYGVSLRMVEWLGVEADAQNLRGNFGAVGAHERDADRFVAVVDELDRC